jgi:dienelactone hydrolase
MPHDLVARPHRHRRVAAALAGLTLGTVAVLGGGLAGAQAPTPPGSVPTSAPEGVPSVVPGTTIPIDPDWVELRSPDGTSQLVGVFRPPKGKGPFPAIISFHGGSGLGDGLAEQAARLARAGFVVVLGCWLPNNPAAAPVWCANTPDPPTAIANLEAFTAQLRGVRHKRIGVVGFSSGAGPVFNYPWGRTVRALAVDSGIGNGPTGEFSDTAAAPVLLEFGTADENIPESAARDFEAHLRANGVDVEAEYYDGAPHVVTINEPRVDVRNAANARMIKFFEQRLG